MIMVKILFRPMIYKTNFVVMFLIVITKNGFTISNEKQLRNEIATFVYKTSDARRTTLKKIIVLMMKKTGIL